MDNSNREGADAVDSFKNNNLKERRIHKHAKHMINTDSFRFSIKFNLNLEHHREAFDRLNKIKKGEKSEFCINCILGKEDENIEIKNLIEATIKTCLEGVQISNTPTEKVRRNDESEIDIMDGVLDFMTSFD
jgi:hypothetical protein